MPEVTPTYSRDTILQSCNAALDDCQGLSEADIKLIARELKERLSAEVGQVERISTELTATIDALQTERAQHIRAIECLRKDRDDLLLALIWCKPRLRHEAYQQHVTWTLSKYPKPPKPEGPPIVRSEDDGTLQDTYRP